MMKLDPTLALHLAISSLLIFLILILFTRLLGLRSFSKLTSVDFAMTIAIGSTISATMVNSSVGLDTGALALAMLYLIQLLTSKLRLKFPGLSRIFENHPVLLMKDGRFIEANLASTKTAKADVYAKLREANALTLASVRAVVFETTGDISVLHGPSVDAELLEELL